MIIAFLLFAYVAFANAKIPRIHQGRLVKIEEVPYQVQIFMIVNNMRYDCGGAILSKMSVITAAHCFHNRNFHSVIIYAGSEEKDKGEPIGLDRLEIHPEYDPIEIVSDVAIITLKHPLTYSAKVRSIELARTLHPPGSTLQVAGWGLLEQNDHLPNLLYATQMPLVDLEICKAAYGKILKNAICGGQASGPITCEGDSGSAVVSQNQLIGIVSFGVLNSCGRGPSVFASMPDLSSWIDSQVLWDN